jgi:hypothetical protein
MKKVIRLTESDLVRLVKRVINETNEDFLFGRKFRKPNVDDAASDQLRGRGYSFRGNDDDSHYIVHDGEKFYEDDIEYADFNDTGDIPRVENGKLIIANPRWED